MTAITRRGAMLSAGAAAAVAGVPTVVEARASDPEERRLLTVFRRLADIDRAIIHSLTRRLAGLPSDPELLRRRGFKPDGLTPLDAVADGGLRS